MQDGQVHFEVQSKRQPGLPWSLESATEDRSAAIGAANDLMAGGRAAAVRVTKETLDEETRAFRSVVILKMGVEEAPKKVKVAADAQPICVTPQDLYTVHARERISRLLEAWLERNRATAFELLHRPDLVEKLEASGIDLQHAVQKIAIPEAHAHGVGVHEMIRTFHTLIERAVDRLTKESRRNVGGTIAKDGVSAVAERLRDEPERAFLMGQAVAAALAEGKTWGEKVELLLDMADAAPRIGPGRALALSTLQQPLAEILESKPGIAEIVGSGHDQGANLAALTQLAAVETVQALMAAEATVAKLMPPLSPLALRLADWLSREGFQDTRAAVGRRILRELTGPKRLRPGDPVAEISLLRALAMALTSAAGKLLPLDEVQGAFVARSKAMVTGDFVEAYLAQSRDAGEEATALVWLMENVIGAANKRQASGWLKSVIASVRFEKEIMATTESPAARLSRLARLQRAISRAGLGEEEARPLSETLGELGGRVEAQGRLVLAIGRANAPALQRLSLLLKLANGDTAPLGPAAERARGEALRLLKLDETRVEMTNAPEQVDQFRALLQHVMAKAA